MYYSGSMTSKIEHASSAIIVHRAEPIADQVIPVTTIRIDPYSPKVKHGPGVSVADALAPLDRVYDADADAIAQALHKSLPGGTFDRLVLKLLEIKASHFRVSWVR